MSKLVEVAFYRYAYIPTSIALDFRDVSGQPATLHHLRHGFNLKRTYRAWRNLRQLVGRRMTLRIFWLRLQFLLYPSLGRQWVTVCTFKRAELENLRCWHVYVTRARRQQPFTTSAAALRDRQKFAEWLDQGADLPSLRY